MNARFYASGCFVAMLSVFAYAPAFAAEADAVPLTLDRPAMVGGIEVACTGIGREVREDPGWNAYPLRVEIAGNKGQLLGDARVTIKRGEEALLTVICGGPWFLARLPQGAYRVTAEIEGHAVNVNANVPANGQGRIIIRFPELGGAVSPEYAPPTTP